jgi:flagellar M-ring protein FliF
MNITVGNILKPFSEFWDKQNKKMKTVIIVSAVALILVAIVLTFILNQKSYDVLYRGLSSSEGGEIVTKLESMSVDTKVESDGTILVPRDQVAMLKMQLSSEGYPKSALTYDLFKSNSDFMTTDFEKKKYIIFQLQDRLQESIKTLKGVNKAIVTISAADDSSFVLTADKIPTTASVIIDLESGVVLNSQQVKGVEELVAKSVPGLLGNNVTIIDNTGTILNNKNSDTGIDVAYSKIEMESKASEMVESKIVSLLEPVLGKSGVSVAANVVIDFQKKASTETKYNPVVGDNGVISKIDKTTQNSDGSSGASGVAGTGTNTGVPSYVQGTTGAGGSTNETSTTEYLVNQIQDQIQQDGGEIKDLSVAVMIDKKGLGSDEISKLKEMISFAVGISQDKVVISDIAFTASNDLRKQVDKALTPSLLNQINYLYIAPVALVLLIIFIFYIVKLSKRKKKLENEEDKKFFENQCLPVKQDVKRNAALENIPGAIVLSETRQQGLNREISDFSNSNPDMVAQLLRTWLVEEDD